MGLHREVLHSLRKKSMSKAVCETVDTSLPFYRQAWKRAFSEAIPLSGVFELTPRCNFSCKMCYVHLTENEIPKHGRELSGDEWLAIAEEAKKAGMIWLCVTGGEPLMHPDFEKIWTSLSEMGFFITLQTNAALVSRYKDLFEKYPPHKCKITLYGSNDDTYEKVCGVKSGFTKADEGIQMLKSMNIPIVLVTTVINANLDDIENIMNYVAQNRFEWIPNLNVRSAGRGVDVHMDENRVRPPKREDRFKMREMNLEKKPAAFCKGYRTSFWVVWNGYMRFCSFMNGPDISIREHSFTECWKQLIEIEDNLHWPEECTTCELRKECQRCSALFNLNKNNELEMNEDFCLKRQQEKERK